MSIRHDHLLVKPKQRRTRSNTNSKIRRLSSPARRRSAASSRRPAPLPAVRGISRATDPANDPKFKPHHDSSAFVAGRKTTAVVTAESDEMTRPATLKTRESPRHENNLVRSPGPQVCDRTTSPLKPKSSLNGHASSLFEQEVKSLPPIKRTIPAERYKREASENFRCEVSSRV